MQSVANTVATLQHFLVVLGALGAATALAWHGTLDAAQAMGVIGAALVYGGVTASPPASAAPLAIGATASPVVAAPNPPPSGSNA